LAKIVLIKFKGYVQAMNTRVSLIHKSVVLTT